MNAKVIGLVFNRLRAYVSGVLILIKVFYLKFTLKFYNLFSFTGPFFFLLYFFEVFLIFALKILLLFQITHKEKRRKPRVIYFKLFFFLFA